MEQGLYIERERYHQQIERGKIRGYPYDVFVVSVLSTNKKVSDLCYGGQVI